MATAQLLPTPAPANPPVLIPTLFARLHAEIAACESAADVQDATLRMHPQLWDMSAHAHRSINQALTARYEELARG